MARINHTYLVDDNEFVLMIGKKAITNHKSYDMISTFENGLLAFNALKYCLRNNQPLPELIILDLNMPVMNGWQFLKAITATPELVNLTVYLCTTPVDAEIIEKAKEFKLLKGFLPKSLPFAEIDRLATSILGIDKV